MGVATGTLKADTWTLSETQLAGYTKSDWVCVGGTQVGSDITVGLGESATCTITATGKAGSAVHAVRCLAEVAAGRKKGVKILRWLDQAPREVEG